MHPSILLLARFCKEVGLFHFVGSPGSRSAPVLLALKRIGGIEIEMVMDERSAAYVALGKSLALGKPIGLFCTSGTAVLNMGPAIAEAFYQQIPLFLLTADRPPELIDQHEGQAIRQNQVFAAHTIFSSQLPSTENSEQSLILTKRLLNEAWQHLNSSKSGPVHLNIPLREPLYPSSDFQFESFEKKPLLVAENKSSRVLDRYELSPVLEAWNKAGSKLIIAGQLKPNPEIRNALKALSEYGKVPVAGDLIHNLFGFPGLIQNHDLFRETFWENENASPEILLTIGNGLLSKPLKKLIQKRQHKEHWHIQEEGQVADPFGSITKIIRANEEWMLTKLGEGSFFQNQTEANPFFSFWMESEARAEKAKSEFAESSSWSDGKAVSMIFNNLPQKTILFPGNSMPIRYANWFSSRLKTDQKVFANRGTSGIDGCLSTALGIAIKSEKETVIAILGDMGFFYDRNGLWRTSIPSNLKILILNNGGGNIFRIIPGSGQMPELEDYFELTQPFRAEWAAKEADLPYFAVKNEEDLKSAIPAWLNHEKCAIMECITDKIENADWVKNLKLWMNQHT
jgi:2-succinyl-5-enolpyruvyl-6-hydroxy-3-cyclohexene-1-carboxylate synthase